MSQRKLQSIARSDAVANFSSAEQLDQRLVLVGGKSWILLWILISALVLAILAGFLGSVPHHISGEGLILQHGRPVIIKSPSAVGGVVQLVVPVGDVVKAGQQILVVSNREIDKELSTSESYLASLKTQDDQLSSAEAKLIAKQESSVDAQIKVANVTLEQSKKLVTMYESEVKNLEALAEKKLISNTQLVQGRSSLFTAMQQLANQSSLIAQAQAGLESTLSSISQGKSARLQLLLKAEEDVAKVRIKHEEATSVLAPIAGKVIKHMVDLGSVLESGSAVATILPVTGMQAEDVEYYVSAYLPYGYAKQVRIGMPVVVSLFFAKPSRYGYIKGTINAIGEFATGGSDTAILVGSTSLASKLGSEVGTTMLEVSIALEADPLTPSGFAWTSDIGYPGEVPVLSLCSVEVTVRDDRPIDLVVPWIKDMVGIDQPPELTGSDSGTAK